MRVVDIDVILLTASSPAVGEIQPLVEIYGRIVGSGKLGPITQKILEEFKKGIWRPEAGYSV